MSKPVAALTQFQNNYPYANLVSLDANFSSLLAAVNDSLTYANYLLDTSGSANTINVTFPVGVTVALTAGTGIQFRVANTNTAGVNLNLNSLGLAPLINPDGSAMAPGQLQANGVYAAMYDGTEFQLIGSWVNPTTARTATEISLGIAPTNVAYPPGNIFRYGADPTGVASSWTALNNAVKVAKASVGTVTIPAGNFLIDVDTAGHGTITLEWVSLVGVQVANIYGLPTSQGSVLNITGVSVSPFAMRRGTSFKGINFFYPNQNTDGVSPTVYPPTIADDGSDGPINNCYIENCRVFNAYRFFVSTSAAIGGLWIVRNSIYGILTCIELQYNPDSVYIDKNEFSFSVFNTAQLETNPSFRYTTRTSGTAILVHQTDGMSISNNTFFGYNFGLNAAITTAGGNGGLIQQCQIVGNIFDQTVFGIAASGAGLFNLNTITGNLITGYDNVTAQHTLVGNSVKISTSGAGPENNNFGDNIFSICTGDHVNISGNTPTRGYSFVNNQFDDWGTFQAAGTYAALNISGSNTSFNATGNKFNATIPAGATTTGIQAACSQASITANDFVSTGVAALGVGGTPLTVSTLTITGNTSIGMSGGTFDDNVTATTLYEIGNQWGRPSHGSTYIVPLAAWTQAANDAAAAAASPPVPVGALYYNTTVGAVKVRLV